MSVARWLTLLVGGALAVGLRGETMAAQTGSRFTVGPGVTALRLQSRSATGASSELTGLAFGGEGSVALGRVALELGYWQGGLDPTSAGAPARDLIEGRALLGVRAASWLAVKAGAHARSYVTAAGTERWAFWQIRLRAVGVIVEPGVRGHLELWRALSAEVNAPQPLDHAQGGEAGLTIQLPRAPLWLRLAYGIEDVELGSGARRETVETLSLTIGIGKR